MSSLDRFAHGFPDQQAAVLKPIGFCTYEMCRQPITPDQDFVTHDGDYFCDRDCFCNHMGVKDAYQP